METRRNYFIRILLITLIISALNVVGYRFFFRLDFTADDRYTLSKATKNILKTIEEPITVKAYFSKNLPPNIAETRTDFKDLLVEYASWSGGNIVYEFINPNESEELERDAQMNGVSPVMVNMRERDEVKQMRAYLGAVILKGEAKDAIPFLQPGAAMEYALSSAIKKISVADKPSIAIIQGHGEPSLGAIGQATTLLNVLFNVEPLTIDDTTEIRKDYKCLAWIAPKDSIPLSHFQKVDEYMNRGGRLYIAINKVHGDLQNSSGRSVNTGLDEWLRAKGIQVDDQFIVDASCGSVSVRQQQGFFTFNTPMQFPFLPLIKNFAQHPITAGVESVLLPFASPVYFNGKDTTVRIVTLATTSDKTGTQPSSTYFDIRKQWTKSDFPTSHLSVGIALEGKIGNAAVPTKMVVYGDGDFAVNGEGEQVQQLQPDNVNLMVNAIDWLGDDTGLNELRTKGVTSRPIKAELEDGDKTMIKYGNFLSPIVLVILYGIARNRIRKRKRQMWMATSYE